MTFIQMIQHGTLSGTMKRRMKSPVGSRQPGHYPIGKAPAPLWPVPVEGA